MGKSRKHAHTSGSNTNTPKTSPDKVSREGQATSNQIDSNKVRIRKPSQRQSHGSMQVILPFLRYSWDVLSKIMSLLKWPLALFLTISLARFLLYRSVNRLTGLVSSQVRFAACSIPFAVPILDNVLPGLCTESKPVNFENLIELQKQSAQVIPAYTGSAPLRLKKAEMATNDLRIVLQSSDLTCKESLDTALSTFSGHSRDASRAIQKTVVRVGGLLDTSLALNEWAVAELSKPDVPTSFFGRALGGDNRARTTDTYIKAMDTLSASLSRLIETNQQAYESLDYLEEDLHGIHEIVSMEKRFQETEQTDILSSLWSVLGGNKKLKSVFKTNLATLDDFERGRKVTKDLVAQTSVAFHKMMLQIEHLREEVARPGLSLDDIPVEMHIRTIQLGIESLRGARDKKKISNGDDEEDGLLL